jgi:RND family efflux transporter MFP subunit
MAILNRRTALIAAGILVCGSFLVLAQESTAPDAGKQNDVSALVTTATLHQGPISTTVSGYGTVAAIPGKTQNLTFPQAGLVTEVRVTAGEAVKRGATLITLTNDPAGRMAFQQAETGLTFARAELDRTRQLRTQNLATESQVAAADKAYRDALSALETQRELGAAAPHSELKAPFDGIVLDVPVAPGDRTAAGAVLARTIANGSVQLLAGFSPQDARRVTPGMPATIQPAGTDSAPIKAQVTHVQAMVNPTSRLIDIVLEPADHSPSAELLTSEAVYAVITVATNTAWLAPRAAVLRDEAGAYLFLIVDGHAKRINVSTPGAENDQEIAVEGPFDAASKVAVSGAYELEDGMAVREADQSEAADKAPAP